MRCAACKPASSLVCSGRMPHAVSPVAASPTQDAFPSLDAARKPVPTAATAAAANKPPRPGPSGPGGELATAELDAALREGHRPDSADGGSGSGSSSSYSSDGSSSSSSGSSSPPPAVCGPEGLGRWSWALRRVEARLGHPAQPYLATALMAATAAEARRGPDATAATATASEAAAQAEATSELLRRAKPALAPAAAGGAACGGANLAWYLQYQSPAAQPRQGRTALRLLPYDLVGAPGTGRTFSWRLGRWQGAGDASRLPRGWSGWLSGAQPCTAFRVWLSVVVEQPASPATATAAAATAGSSSGSSSSSSGGSGGEGREALEELEAEVRRAAAAPARTLRHDVEVTALAAPLPAVVPEGRWHVRNRS